MRISLLICWTILALTSCEKEDALPDQGCNNVYSLDLLNSRDRIDQVWLTDGAGSVVSDSITKNDNTAGTTYFYNYQNACTNIHNVSVVSSAFGFVPPGDYSFQVDIKQVGEVASGSALNLQAFEDLFAPERYAPLLSNTLIFSNCPPLSTVWMQGRDVSEIGTVAGRRISYDYREDNSGLFIYADNYESEGAVNLISVQKMEDASWWGRSIDWNASFGVIGFETFEPLVVKNLQLDLPNGLDSFRTEIRWVENNGRPQAALVATFNNQTAITCRVPESGNGYLIKTILYGEDTYIHQHFFSDWPTEVRVNQTLAIEEFTIDYPTVRVKSNLGDLVFLSGTTDSEPDNIILLRQAVMKLKNGEMSRDVITAEGTLLRSEKQVTTEKYEAGFLSGLEGSVYHYPQLNGNYYDIIRSAFRISNTQESWLRTQVYEGVRRKIND